MKTSNLNLNLMIPSQVNKDITYNESMLKLDCFANNSINGFITEKPSNLEVGEKYILLSGEDKNIIYYRSHESKNILEHKPSKGMTMFLINKNKFIFFNGNEWLDCIENTARQEGSFISIQKLFKLPAHKAVHYLYLAEDVNLSVSKMNFSEITILLKQSVDNLFKINWPRNILWPNADCEVVIKKNSMVIVKLYALPETDHYLGSIIAQNFSY
ncbi:MAG: hypothetical protein DGJ47_000723 [Rickettsiaceae bacterium]